MTRIITSHVAEGDTGPQLALVTIDRPGHGGAHHAYEISWFQEDVGTRSIDVPFQNGPIKEHGINGLTQEVLLAIVIDRLRCFQAGMFPSEYNATALAHCEHALQALQQRTKDRITRGVEGQSRK